MKYRGFTFLLTTLLSLTGFSQSFTSYVTGDEADVDGDTQFGVCLMGGAGDHDNAIRWMLERAGGGDILVIRASQSDGYNDYFYSDLGVSVNSVETIVFHEASAAQDPYVLQQLENAECIWIAGGDQWDYVSYWRDTEVEEILNAHVLDAPIGGTSAGMAILGEAYFSAENGSVTSSVSLQFPLGLQTTVEQSDFLAVPFLQNTITDTHYDNPDRKGRHAAFMARVASASGARSFGIACNEYTAVCIDEQGEARVFGEYPEFPDKAYFIQSNCTELFLPEVLESGSPLTWNLEEEALKVYEVFGDWEGTSNFQVSDWSTGQGGTWTHWWVEAGELFEAPGSGPSCPLSTAEFFQDGREIWIQDRSLYWSDDNRPLSVEWIDMAGRSISSQTLDHQGQEIGITSTGIYLARIRWADGFSLMRVALP